MFYSCSLNSVLAWIAWSLSFVGGCLYAFVSQEFGVFAVLLAAIGATLHVRGFIYGLEERERAAYEMGRESVRLLR